MIDAQANLAPPRPKQVILSLLNQLNLAALAVIGVTGCLLAMRFITIPFAIAELSVAIPIALATIGFRFKRREEEAN